MAEEYDVVILGGGTGGYVAAIRASQLGLKTAVVEKRKLGGTCLHSGCIPSKALLRSAEVYRTVKKSEEYGILKDHVGIDFAKVQQRKEGIVNKLYGGVQHLLKQGKISVYEGMGRILGPSIFSPMPGTISVEMNDGSDNAILLPQHVIIATGSRPKTLPGLVIDGQYVLSSEEALQLETLPQSIIIIGGGAIGIEWASLLHDFGVQVTVLEYAPYILPHEDEEVAKEMMHILQKKGVRIVTEAKVLPETLKTGEVVSIKAVVNGEPQEYTGDKILVSVGRDANVTNIGLENTEIAFEQGYISTNSMYQTKESHIYAIGDCIGGLQLAHVAAREGIIAVEHLARQQPSPLDPSSITRCIYASPEIASVGYTEQEALKKGFTIKVGKFPFKAIGKALVYGETEGFVKIIADEQTNDVLGVHMIGPHVTDMISEASLAKVLDATPWEIASAVHPHPSLSEAIGEAALAVDGLALHF
ncbi:dihydrolipoyl dehydrogenase [Peribacillus asahii]|uniref:dihydrolipoyl dehydrogenase n=1 Tax=Peribacillus asahii TaxID=228899 RepID=UPI00207AB64F|nr:dihydrolipoyl dehydrogenase [Peribacillus asahii]USK69104.1 dihydrolipoyl dehydrogenase [Peribacillus asahii]